MSGKFIVTNFAYGTGPYLRTTELALDFNNELERNGQEKLGIIVPLVYGEKQRKVMTEEFGSTIKNEIIFDEKLGKILGSVFYSGALSYEAYLKSWVENCRAVSEEARDYLKKAYGDGIVVELARSPRIRYDVAPAYFTSFAYLTEILSFSKDIRAIRADRGFLERGAVIADWVESVYRLHAIAYPGTFSYAQNYRSSRETEALVPPLAKLSKQRPGAIQKGILVTKTGIPGLDRIYSAAKDFGLKIYGNEAIASIADKGILFHFARSGFGSVWLSMLANKLLLVPDFDAGDDPEIYFNNIAVEKLGIGVVYRGQLLEEILALAPKIKENSKKLCEEIRSRWSDSSDPLDGNKYCAQIFAKDYLRVRN